MSLALRPIIKGKLEARRAKIVEKRLEVGKGFLGTEALKQVTPGARPKTTKKSKITDHRPRVLSTCPIRKYNGLDFYFDCYYKFKDASKKLREGILDVIFPPGMFKPTIRPPPPQPI